MTDSDVMQRFTVKLSFQPGRKLGLILIDAPVHDSVSPSATNPGSDVGVNEEAPTNVRGGESTLRAHDDESESGDHGSEENEREDERPTMLQVSGESPVFKLVQQLRSSENGHNPSNTDAPIEWVNTQHRSLVSLERFNKESLMFALTGTIKSGDVVEKIQCTCAAPARAVATARAVLAKGRADSGERRCRPYARSDHYTVINFERRSAVDMAGVLKCPQNYPLYITFRRASADCHPPPCKRLKTSESLVCHTENRAITNEDEIMSLLDSSDEEESEVGDNKISTDGVGADNQEKTSLQESTEMHTQYVPSDPCAVLLTSPVDERFVLTPFGPGRIVSSRVERHASANKHSEGTIFRPIIMYTVDVHYGTCHVPASQVKPMPQRTLITYQRVSLNEHDVLRLRPRTHLNDSVVMFYLKYLKARLDQDNKGETSPESRGWDDLDGRGVHIFPSFCYARIQSLMAPGLSDSLRSIVWDYLKTWTKSVDLFQKKLLLFPIRKSRHWSCICVCHPGRLVRRWAKDLAGQTTPGSGASCPAACSATLPEGAVKTTSSFSRDHISATVDRAALSRRERWRCDFCRAKFDEYAVAVEHEKTCEENPDSATVDRASLSRRIRWRCDFCRARFDEYAVAVEHEKTCEENVEWCMIHFDSGKHLRLHNRTEIMSDIGRYLNAYFDSEYATSHPRMTPFTEDSMPGFSAWVPQQDDVRDCGVHMLENAEKMLSACPTVDNAFVRAGGHIRRDAAGTAGRSKNYMFQSHADVIEKKRYDILHLIQAIQSEDERMPVNMQRSLKEKMHDSKTKLKACSAELLVCREKLRARLVDLQDCKEKSRKQEMELLAFKEEHRQEIKEKSDKITALKVALKTANGENLDHKTAAELSVLEEQTRRALDRIAVARERAASTLENERLCVVCQENRRSVLFLKCQHLCVCRICGRGDLLSQCPLCREAIVERINVFA